MTDQQFAGAVHAQQPEARLEPDAIGVAQDTVIGMANAGPTLSVGLSIAALAAAAAYGSGPVILLCAVPMLIIANAYRRLNLWNANCGASFEWVGRAISPYLGFMTGWLMISANLVGNIAAVVALAPSILAIFGTASSSAWPNIGISTAVALLMIVIAIAGIRITAKTQVGLAIAEYLIMIALTVTALIAVFSHHAGTFAPSSGWLHLGGIGGHGSLAAGLLLAVFMFTGWDATVYLNEEVKHKRVNPGRAAMLAVVLLAVFYAFCTTGLQGAVSPKALQAHAASPLVYIGQVLGGGSLAKVVALSLALSVIAGVGTGIVVLARIVYSMAVYKVLPPVLGNISHRFSTPAIATVVLGVVFIAATWAYLLSASIANLFSQLIAETGILFASFYILTALAAIVYYRRRIMASVRDAVTLGVLPIAAILFMEWIILRSVQSAAAPQNWSLAGIIIAGLMIMVAVRLTSRPAFFETPRETADR